MKKLKIEIEINLEDSTEVAALQTFLAAIASEDTAATQPKKRKPRTTSKKAAPAPKDAPKETPAEAPASEEETSEITAGQVREKVRELAKTHRTEIKEKLGEFDAKNVTALKAEHYSEFMEFLNGLS